MFDKITITTFVEKWLEAWNRHDLDGVLQDMADDVVFEHWNGRVIRGKRQLERVWQPWFSDHGDFHFELKSLSFDEAQQSLSFEWKLGWPSPEPGCRNQWETREGVDLIQLSNGKVINKRSYIKTILKIDNRSMTLKL